MKTHRRTTKPSIERTRTLAMFLRQDRAFTASEMARHFETTRKTIGRDLEFMRDRLGYEFRFDSRRCRYVLISAPAPVI
jgi:predicted DNA-binding transcriptional regulator YafY